MPASARGVELFLKIEGRVRKNLHGWRRMYNDQGDKMRASIHPRNGAGMPRQGEGEIGTSRGHQSGRYKAVAVTRRCGRVSFQSREGELLDEEVALDYDRQSCVPLLMWL